MTKIPWNKNKSVGQKKALTPRQSRTIRDYLENKGSWMELALFNTAIDSMLRASDLVRLIVEDVCDWKGNVKSKINIKQKKTRQSHVVCLYDDSKKALKKWIKESAKYEDDWLFTATTRTGRQKSNHLSEEKYRLLVKEWVKYLHLDPKEYSTHSLRRTRAVLMWKNGTDLETIRILLGQSSIESTKNYLGVDREDALEINSKFVI